MVGGSRLSELVLGPLVLVLDVVGTAADLVMVRGFEVVGGESLLPDVRAVVVVVVDATALVAAAEIREDVARVAGTVNPPDGRR